MAISTMLNPRAIVRMVQKYSKRLSKSSSGLPTPTKSWNHKYSPRANARPLPHKPTIIQPIEYESDEDSLEEHSDSESGPTFVESNSAQYPPCQWVASYTIPDTKKQPDVLPATLADVAEPNFGIDPKAIFPDWDVVQRTQDVTLRLLGHDFNDVFAEPASPFTSNSGPIYADADSEEEEEVQYASSVLLSPNTNTRTPSLSFSSPASTFADELSEDAELSETETYGTKTKFPTRTCKRKRDDSEDEEDDDDDDYVPRKHADPDFVPNTSSAPPRRKRVKLSSPEPAPEPSVTVPVECHVESIPFPNPRCPVKGCNQTFAPDETPITVGRHFLTHSSKPDRDGHRKCLLPRGKVMREEVKNRGRQNEETRVFFKSHASSSETCNAVFTDGTSIAKSLGRHILSDHMPLDVLVWCSRCHQRLARRDTMNRHSLSCGNNAEKEYKKQVKFFQNGREVTL